MPPAAEAAPRIEVREGRALGSRLRLLVDGPAGDRAIDRAWRVTLREFDSVDVAMSRFRDDSELTRLNRAGGVSDAASRLLASGLALAERARRETGGRFDPRVVGDLERLGFAAVPQAWRGQPDRAVPVLRRIGRTGRITLSGAVDLGGLGKGIALRRGGAAVARRLPGAAFLLDAGGDIVTGGAPAGPTSWSIGIEDPGGDAMPLATLTLGSGWGVATSSTRVGRRGDGRIHHLIDPSTGEPGGDGLASVTVAWRDPAWAEVWSKALFLEGVAGIGSAARRRGLAAWWVAVDGSLEMTPAARQVTSWVRAEAGISPL